MSRGRLVFFRQLVRAHKIAAYLGWLLLTPSPLVTASPSWAELQQLAEYQQKQGDYQAAASRLQQALKMAQTTADPRQIATTMGTLGNVYIALRRSSLAKQHLQQSIQLLRTLHLPAELASSLNNLGNYHAFNGDYLLASQSFEESHTVATASGAITIAAQALANQTRVKWQAGHFPQAHVLFKQALAQTKHLANDRNKAFLLINLATTLKQFESTENPHLLTTDTPSSYSLLKQATDISDTTGDSFAAAHAWRQIAALYEQAGRYQDALQLTQKSLFHAQQSDTNSRYLLLQGYQQMGRLQRASGHQQAAITAYRMAVNLLQQTRHQMTQAYRAENETFRESGGALYYQLADLLLQSADKIQDQQPLDTLLREVRDIIELSKAAEIRNYFDDECVDGLKARRKQADEISPSAAIIYPILLDQRLELLLARSGHPIKRYTVAVSRTQLTKQIRLFRRLLEKRSTYQYRKPAQQLYTWLIQPFMADLSNTKVETLVFVPDGPLRTIPMTALHDGKQHLIEQYAVVTTPAIELTDPQPLSAQTIRVTAAGLSEAVGGFPALTSVQAELQAVHNLYDGHLLVNKTFVNDALKRALSDTRLNVLHIATHAQFKSSADDSFLLTYEGRLTLNQLADYVGLFKFRQTPLELLVLSACETAQGDDRAALGLSGIAIKAGARSAIGSLWQANDAATAELMTEFYQQLQIPHTSRARAMQRAQLKLVADIRYRHPAYWSAFLLINSWL